MFDVFYSGKKPNLFVHEKPANSIEHAQTLSKTRCFWWINYLTDYSGFDFLYEPRPWQAHQRHAWPSQWQNDSGTYLVPRTWDHKETNYHCDSQLIRKPAAEAWEIPPSVKDWDTSWHPDPSEPEYTHEFATEWHNEGGPVYLSNSPLRKYHNEIKAKLTDSELNWQFDTDCTIDQSWRPHPRDPAYIYVFGNQWWPAEVFSSVKYIVPGATEVKYMTHPRAILPERHDRHWHTIVDCHWDYSWRPDPGDPPYIYVFGNQWWPAEKMPTVEYHVPGATERKYMSWPRAELLSTAENWTVPSDVEQVDLSWVPDPGDPPYIYQFGTQWQRTGGAIYRVPGASEIKYVAYPRGIKISNDNCWSVPDGVDIDSFDWTWHPDATDPPYIYQFGTQHQRTGGPVYTVSGATEIKYVDQIRINSQPGAAAVIEIDHLDGNAGQIPDTIRRVRYFDNYRDTLIRIAKSLGPEHEYVWICSSICDYSNFDFSWHPEQWQATMLHVFASDGEKFGDTFFMHVPTFAARAESKALLEWYDVNFVNQSVPRRPLPVILHQNDTQVTAVKNSTFNGPLALFTNKTVNIPLPAVNLWRQEVKAIVPLDRGAESVIVPKQAVPAIATQLYDYPNINKAFRNLSPAQQQDIVFISYDEPEAEENWQKLSKRFDAKRVHGVKGMEAALEAAAEASSTPWYYAVFAKTQLAESFDFSFVPDRMQQPKHYIFDCENRSNGLVYGHMGVVLYNVKGIQYINQQETFGLDYTLSFAHESVPILSCYGDFATTPYHAWRTAFRESAKLAYFETVEPSVDGAYRLRTWTQTAQGRNNEWVLCGARDGVEFFKTTQGSLELLKQSFKWDWLRDYFESRYGNLE